MPVRSNKSYSTVLAPTRPVLAPTRLVLASTRPVLAPIRPVLAPTGQVPTGSVPAPIYPTLSVTSHLQEKEHTAVFFFVREVSSYLRSITSGDLINYEYY